MKGSIVIYDLCNRKHFYFDKERTKRRFSPASTIKIFNSLVGLEGWYDRVFCRGNAYGYDSNGTRQIGMKKQKLGLLICTAGYSREYLEEIGIAESMRNVMIDDRLGQRFEKKELIILGGTIEIDKVRDQHLSTAQEVGRNIDNLLPSRQG